MTRTVRSLISAIGIAAVCVAVILPARRSHGDAMSTAGLEYRTKGPADAKILLTEFSDFQCPSCNYARPPIEALLKQYDGKVRLLFRHFPLQMHSRARDAAVAAECAGRQGKFWPVHDALFDHQRAWPDAPDPWVLFNGYAKAAGADMAAFNACVSGGEALAAIERDVREGDAWQVQSTPTLFVGHKPLAGARQIQVNGPLLVEKLLKKK